MLDRHVSEKPSARMRAGARRWPRATRRNTGSLR